MVSRRMFWLQLIAVSEVSTMEGIDTEAWVKEGVCTIAEGIQEKFHC